MKTYEAKTEDHLGTHQAIRKGYGETCNNTVNYRISGVPISAVEQQETTRENKVKTLIEKFEKHQHKESLLQDLSQTQNINKFSKESQDLMADMNNTEIFEFLPNSNVPDLNAYWEIGIIYCSCGRNMKFSRSVQQSSIRTTVTSPQSLDM